MKELFVFTTNTLGQHTSASAKLAYKKHGARWGLAYGQYGNSFAIPTRGHDGPMDMKTTQDFISGFIAYAAMNPHWDFKVATSGDLLPHQFINVTGNVLLPEQWKQYLGDDYNYWS